MPTFKKTPKKKAPTKSVKKSAPKKQTLGEALGGVSSFDKQLAAANLPPRRESTADKTRKIKKKIKAIKKETRGSKAEAFGRRLLGKANTSKVGKFIRGTKVATAARKKLKR